MALNLRPLEQTDLARLHDWLNKPHLRPFYMREAISLEDVCEKYTPRIGDQHATKSVIASDCDHPFGYMQWYLNHSYPEYGAAVSRRLAGVSIDYFIGDERYLRRGLGSEMLNGLVRQTFPRLAPQDRIFHIGHDNRNLRAIRCTKRAGFAAVGEFVEDETHSTLFVLDVSD